MIAVLFWIGFALSCGSVFLLKRKIEFVKCAVLGMIYYVMFYVIVSGLLFLCGQFSLKRVAFLSVLIWGVCFIFFALHYKGRGTLSLLPIEKKSWVSYLIIVVLLIAFSGSFGYFGMGQDEGVYQIEAINFSNGSNEWLTTFPEYDQIKDEEYKTFYREAIDAIPGVELVDVEYGFRDTFQIPQYGGLDVIYHGIPTYPAVLGLGVKLFGMEHMMLFQVVFYVVLLLLMEILLRERRVHWLMRAVLITVLGISPEILWMRKSTLTEMFLATLMTYYLYKVTDEDDRQKSFSVLPIIVFSFFHASAFSILPIFIVNYWVLYLVKKDIRFLRNAAEALAGFCVGFVMMLRVQPIYMSKNFLRLMDQNGVEIPYTLIPGVIILLAIVVAVAGFLFRLIRKDIKEKVLRITSIANAIIAIVVSFDFVSGRPWWGGFFTPDSWLPDLPLIGTSTFMGYLMLTGFFLVPGIVYGLVVQIRKRGCVDIVLISNTFAWTVLIYSMFMRVRVMSYYYNARYLVPFFPIIIVLYGFLFNEPFNKIEKTKGIKSSIGCWIRIALPVLGICFMSPFSNVIRSNQDDTNLQWGVLNSVINSVKPGDTVLIDQNEMWLFFYPVRSRGAIVYPVIENVETTIKRAGIDPDNQRLYYMSENRSFEDDWRYEVVYESKSSYQLDDQNHFVEYLRLPTEFAIKGERRHILYHRLTPETEVTALEDNFGRGWTITNAAGFRWMCDKEASVGVYLEKRDYRMHLHQGDTIPFQAISDKQITVKTYLNGHELSTLVFTEETNGSEFVVDLPAEYMEEGQNLITFETEDFWSPREYGQEDANLYAFSIGSFLFECL